MACSACWGIWIVLWGREEIWDGLLGDVAGAKQWEWQLNVGGIKLGGFWRVGYDTAHTSRRLLECVAIVILVLVLIWRVVKVIVVLVVLHVVVGITNAVRLIIPIEVDVGC